jgi:hypothetical protein
MGAGPSGQVDVQALCEIFKLDRPEGREINRPKRSRGVGNGD